MDTVLAAVDMAGVSDFVTTTGVVIVAVYLGFKGIQLARRVIGAA